MREPGEDRGLPDHLRGVRRVSPLHGAPEDHAYAVYRHGQRGILRGRVEDSRGEGVMVGRKVYYTCCRACERELRKRLSKAQS